MAAAEGNSLVEAHQKPRGFMANLTSAACEWFLIFLLLIDAVLSYLLTKFADYCKLQTPCILCSRLDHVIGNERPEFYRNLLCRNHISEISSLISCHIHGKLADGHGMCDDCIFSFTRKNLSFSEMNRILGGKLGLDNCGSGLQSLVISDGSVGTKPCSCCGKPWRPKQNKQRFFQIKSPGNVFPKRDFPLPRFPSHSRLHHRNTSRKMKNQYYHSIKSQGLGKRSFVPLSDVGYTELNINSDSESEVAFSDDDGRSTIPGNSEYENDFLVLSSENPSKVPSNDLISAKVINFSDTRPLLSEMWVQSDVSKAHLPIAFDGASADCIARLNWQESPQKPNPCRLPELILPEEKSTSSNVSEIPQKASIENKLELPDLCDFNHISHEESIENKVELPDLCDFNPLGWCDLFTLDYCPSFVQTSSVAEITGTSDIRHASIDNPEEVLQSLSIPSATCVETCQVVDNLILKPKHIDESKLCELNDSEMERESSSRIVELSVMRKPDRLNEEPKMMPSSSEDTSTQGIDLSLKNTRRWEHDHGDVQITSSSDDIQIFRRSASVESSLESLDAGNVSEIEGESITDRLRRQVEYDRKCIKSLYKELGEERSAASVAANQAMAMITRLQEEKSALHMEALQYLRMMEEQAEYDVDALQKANDLLAEREKEMQDMEAELEFYRLNFPDETVLEDLPGENFELNGMSMKVDNAIIPCQDNKSLPPNLMIAGMSKDSEEPSDTKIPHLGFEEEKMYISRCLQSLEMKLHEISCSVGFSSIGNGEHSKIFADDRIEGEEYLKNEKNLANIQTDEYDSSLKEDLHKCNGSYAAQEDATSSDGEYNHRASSDRQKCFPDQREVSLAALESEVSDLNDRLEALEADHCFLEHMINSLQNGNKGLQFVQEVTHQLKELRKIGIRLRNQSAS
ncbi:myosin-binding protein 1-like [Humulus lupulus]|uniref:myosin-binding protein 1-like n=1 Tax=Humulus lupulus TaxID=3486 RepID=UPI002B400D00|nr:myosin-binding protein 1-like [Humulus lupulus]XP_062080682.1 myosin-binding protein 1-like [Humulus lupulus]